MGKDTIKINKAKVMKYALPAFLIIVAILFSSYFRLQTLDLPVTDEWARQSVDSQIKSQLVAQVESENPFLPDSAKQAELNRLFNEYVSANSEEYNKQIQTFSNQIKAELQDDSGQTYLLAIDPYLWYGYAKNYLECGNAGCDLKEDGKYYTYRNGREGKTRTMAGVPAFGIMLYSIFNIFGNPSILSVMFLIPAIMIGLACIPGFFLGKRFGGNVGGFVTAMIIALDGALLGRTPAGFSDTDASNILFPLLIMWMFVLAYDAKDLNKSSIFSVLGALSFFLYSKFWSTEHIFGLLGLSVIAFVIYDVVIGKIKKMKTKAIIEEVKMPIAKSAIFGIFSLVALMFSQGFEYITRAVAKIFSFVTIKDVGTVKLWPNVMTTVAEFNTRPFWDLIPQLGGWLLFTFAIIGVVMLFFTKEDKKSKTYMYPILIAVWVAGTAYSFTKGMRFSLLVLPSFAVAVGAGVGIFYTKISKWSEDLVGDSAKVLNPILAILIIGILIGPSVTAAGEIMKNEVPSYNDAWDESLDKIKADADDGIGYITTWWDFGHWFVAKGIRVTFDGGDQGERIHWVGKSLLADNEKLSVGIIRMLNCGQEDAPHVLEKYLDNDTVKAIDVLNNIVQVDKTEATSILESEGFSPDAIAEVLDKTHCEDLLPQYYIASEDMVGKAGVWGHFGSWDFRRAKIYQTTKKMTKDEAVEFMTTEMNLTEDVAQKYYGEIITTEADRWISPWPGFYGGEASCQNTNTSVTCGNGVTFDLVKGEATLATQQGTQKLKSLAYIDGNGEFQVLEQDSDLPYSAILMPDKKSMIVDPLIAGSMFTRLFYFNGVGLEHFEKFDERRQVTGQRIQVWKVNFDNE